MQPGGHLETSTTTSRRSLGKLSDSATGMMGCPSLRTLMAPKRQMQLHIPQKWHFCSSMSRTGLLALPSSFSGTLSVMASLGHIREQNSQPTHFVLSSSILCLWMCSLLSITSASGVSVFHIRMGISHQARPATRGCVIKPSGPQAQPEADMTRGVTRPSMRPARMKRGRRPTRA